MSGKKDISGRKDVEAMINAFYKKAIADEQIGFFFTEVVHLDWDVHLPVMYQFWETTLFHKASYRGNPMMVHLNLHQKHALTKAHFDRWLDLFQQTVDELFQGEKAELAKLRAGAMAMVLQAKINLPSS